MKISHLFLWAFFPGTGGSSIVADEDIYLDALKFPEQTWEQNFCTKIKKRKHMLNIIHIEI